MRFPVNTVVTAAQGRGIDITMRSDDSLQRIFRHTFCVRDIAQALLSFDETAPADEVGAVLREKHHEVAGVRTGGLITSVVSASDLGVGSCHAFARKIEPAQVVADTLPFAQLVARLAEHPRLFVSSLGAIGGVVTRHDLGQPPGRMWLFGMITLMELRFSRMIERNCPEETWKAELSEGRLQKTEALLAERLRRHQQVTLAECLQFADKTQIIARVEFLRRMTRFQSKRQVELMGRQLEGLRNSLAHAQDLVATDWDTIVALADNLDAVLLGPPGFVE